MIDAKECIKCKGKLLCGLNYCPVLKKFSTRKRTVSRVKGKDFYGSAPPGIFVSWHNYPNPTVSPLSIPSIEPNAAKFDSPEEWFGLSQQRIVSMRESLLGAGKKFKVKKASNPDRKLSRIQELVMSSKPVNAEFSLFKKPSLRLSFSESVAPLGARAPLKNLNLTENPRIPKKVDYLNADTNVKAQTAIMELYRSGLPVSFLYKLLSAGTLGLQKNRRIVPTRWSITAIDSNISRELIEEKIKFFSQISEIRLFHSNYLENSYYALLLPQEWSFEQLECWLPGGTWTQNTNSIQLIQDHEFFEGRKSYASSAEGAYYAARLTVAEYLLKEKRQAACIVFREIGQNYKVPLGVWQIRQSLRNAFSKKPLSFFSLELALKYLGKKLTVPIERYKEESKLLDRLIHQTRLSDFEWSEF